MGCWGALWISAGKADSLLASAAALTHSVLAHRVGRRLRHPPTAALQMALQLGPLPPAMLAQSQLGRQLGTSLAALQRPQPASPHGGGGDGGPAAPRCGAGAAPLDALDLSRPLFRRLAALDRQLADLIRGMLRYDPAQRLTPAQVSAQPAAIIGVVWCDLAFFLRTLPGEWKNDPLLVPEKKHP